MRCPICGFIDDDEYALSLHIESIHFGQTLPSVIGSGTLETHNTTHNAEGLHQDSQDAGRPAVPAAASDDDNEYLPCPEDDCGEQVRWCDLQEHLHLHLAENLGSEDEAESSLTDMYAQEHSSSARPSFQHHYKSSPAVRYIIHSYCSSSGNRPATQSSGPMVPPCHVESWVNEQQRQQLDPFPCELTLRDPFTYNPFDRQLQLVTDHQFEKSSLVRHAQSNSPADESSRVNIRLGKKELGPHANEHQMPKSIRTILEKGGKHNTTQRVSSAGKLYRDTHMENEVRGMVPLLADLIAQDDGVSRAWLCHPAVQHIFKLKDEGGFCGYRNCQMLLAYMIDSRSDWSENVLAMGQRNASEEPKVPHIFDLQRQIERAWDLGYNARGRKETGGILGTRKYIGTPEIQALLQSLNIPHEVLRLQDKVFRANDPRNTEAHEQLLNYIGEYFLSPTHSTSEASTEMNDTCVVTPHAPIYLQQPGHSVTVIGIELRRDGARNLLVLDPGYKTSPAVAKLLDFKLRNPTMMTKVIVPPPPKAKSNKLTKLHGRTAASTPGKSNGRIDGWVRKKVDPASQPSLYSFLSSGYSNSSLQSPSKSSSKNYRESTPPPLFRGGKDAHISTPRHADSSVKGTAETDTFRVQDGTESTVSSRDYPFASPSLSGDVSMSTAERMANAKRSEKVGRLLQAYRRGAGRLGRHREFEMVILDVERYR